MEEIEDQVNLLIRHYSSLVKEAEGLLFPKFRPSTDGENSEWSCFRKWIHRLAHSFSSASKSSLGELLLSFYLIYSALVNFAWFATIIYGVLNHSYSGLSFQYYAGTISSILIFILSMPLAIVVYYWWFETLKKKSRIWKKLIFIGFLFLLTGGFTKSFIAAIPALQHVTLLDVLYICLAYAFLIVPTWSYFLIVSYEAGSALLLLVASFFKGLKSLHDPLPIEMVKKLSLGNIKDEQKPWKLGDLPIQDVRTIRLWAQTNREATDKRTLPTILVISFLTLLLSIDAIKNWVDPRIQIASLLLFSHDLVSGTLSKSYFLSILLIDLLILVLIFLIVIFSRLFTNLSVQSLIIETCLVAENAQEHKRLEREQAEKKGCLPDLLRWISALFINRDG
jgi:hypothetical protein